MKKRLLSGAAALVLALSLALPASGALLEEKFSDVDPGAWYYDNVHYVVDKGLFSGIEEGGFGPGATMNRAMAVTVLYRLAGSPSLEDEILGYPFADVESDSWYSDGVYWARLTGIAGGYSEEHFGPFDPVTREQLAVMLYHYEQKVNGGGLGEDWAAPMPYADADKVSSWAREAICWATQQGIVTGRTDNTLDPQGKALRAEVAAMLERYLEPPVDYTLAENWAYHETDGEGDVDVFFVCPTVYGGGQGRACMALTSEKSKSSFLGATNMEKGIYDDNARFFAPYYRQVGLYVYTLPVEEREAYLRFAYADVKNAFEHYLEEDNGGRPIVLAGFSQGGDLCLRLVKDYFTRPEYAEQLVACYAIGWSITEEELAAHPGLKFAQGETDTGVIISFNSEAEEITDSLTIPAGTRTLAINPVNWVTGGTAADKSDNLGACFTNYDGEIETEIPALTGAYIDSERGALKVTDVTPEEYPPGLDIFADGVYHLYDYQFFYRNLEANVQARIEAFLAEK